MPTYAAAATMWSAQPSIYSVAPPAGFAPGAPDGSHPGSPLYLGSPATGLATPLPGATLSIDEFGLDVEERSWSCPTALAAQLKPDLDAAHPYIPNLHCTVSSSVEGEGLMSTIRATYRGLVSGTLRPPRRVITCDTNSQSQSVILGGATLNSENTPVIEPVFVLREGAKTEPDLSLLGTFDPSPSGALNVPATWSFDLYVVLGSNPAPGQEQISPPTKIGTMYYKPDPRGWLCDRDEWQIAGVGHWARTVQRRLKYLFSGYTAVSSSSSSSS